MSRFWPALVVVCLLFTSSCKRETVSPVNPDLARLAIEKKKQASLLAAAQTNRVPGRVWAVFDAVESGDWMAASNCFAKLNAERGLGGPSKKPSGFSALMQRLQKLIGITPPTGNALQTGMWQPVMETYWASELTRTWNPRWLERYAREIMAVVPDGAIYFGGTDAGRFAVTQFSTSHIQGKPFFTLTQNMLADATYVDYLTGMYGFSIVMPTVADQQQAFQDYLTDAQRRLRDKQLREGENVTMVQGRVNVSGQAAIMEINALLVKCLVAKNPQREFYVEQAFTMYPLEGHLEPLGPIFKLHHAPLPVLSEETMAANREYWLQFITETLGLAAANAQTAEAACEFIERIDLQGDWSGFDGDRSFADDAAARKAFALSRCHQASIYAERAKQAGAGGDARALNDEAGRAFREAWLLWPADDPSTWKHAVPARLYCEFLLEQKDQVAADRVQQTVNALQRPAVFLLPSAY